MTGCTLNRINLPQDLDFLFSAMTNSDQYLHSTKLRFPSKSDFEKWLCTRIASGDFHDFYIVVNTQTNEKIGYVYNYDFSLTDGHCKLAVYIVPKCRDTGVGGYAAILFMKKLFSDYPLRKVYSTIYDYNEQSLKSNLAAGFKEEGHLISFRYYDNKYHDMFILSMTRETFDSKLGRLVE